MPGDRAVLFVRAGTAAMAQGWSEVQAGSAMFRKEKREGSQRRGAAESMPLQKPKQS